MRDALSRAMRGRAMRSLDPAGGCAGFAGAFVEEARVFLLGQGDIM